MKRRSDFFNQVICGFERDMRISPAGESSLAFRSTNQSNTNEILFSFINYCRVSGLYNARRFTPTLLIGAPHTVVVHF